MKKWLIILCLAVFPVFAQEISDNTFSENNPNLIHDNEARTFNGGSFVYIQGISDKPQPKTWMDNMKIKLFGSMEIPNRPSAPLLTDKSSFENSSDTKMGVKTRNFFGAVKEIKYTPHTSNWDFIIQPMDSHTVSIQENIQFLLTEETAISRSWPVAKKNFSLIRAQIDGRFILPNKSENNPQLDFSILPAGLHTINLHYVLSLPIHENFLLPLTFSDWPLITDLFSGVILNGKIGLNNPQFLLGENLQEIPKNFILQTDDQGNIFFKNTHVLPAFTQIQLSAKSSDIAPQKNESLPFSISEFLFFTIIAITISFYLIFSGCEIYFSSLTQSLKRFRKISDNPFKRWFYRMGEICIGSFILLILSFLISVLLQIKILYIYWLSVLLIIVVGIVLLDTFIFYPKQKMIYQLHQNKGEQ